MPESVHRPFGDPAADYTAPALLSLPLALASACAGRAVAFFHARRDVRRAIRGGQNPFVNRLVARLAARGIPSALMSYYRPPWPRWIGGRSLHIYRGPGRPRRGPGVLHLAKGYLDGYWYLDPMGQRAWSSVAGARYDPDRIDPEAANALFRELRRRHVRTGHSARDQAPPGAALPEGAIAVFLQGAGPGAVRGAVCDEAAMVRAVVAARAGRPVLIKAHPRGTSRRLARTLRAVAGPGVEITGANVHDVLGAASVVCTMSSGVGFEALLHRRPVLTFAAADYRHAALRVGDLADLPALLDAAAEQRLNHAKYVWWFAERQLFHLNQPDLDRRLDAVIDAAARPGRLRAR